MDFKQFLKRHTDQPIPKELAFAESEYRLRVDKIRKSMTDKSLDVLLVTFVPNVCYLSGYEATSGWSKYACMIIPAEGDPVLQVMELDAPVAMIHSWVNDVQGYSWTNPVAKVHELVGLLKDRRLDGKRIGVETKLFGLSVDFYQELKRALPDATFVDVSDVVIRTRAVKSPAELDYMRRSSEITKKALAAVLPVIKPGITENDVAAVIYQTLISEGSEFFTMQPTVAANHRAGWMHTSFKRTPIETGGVVLLEFGAVYNRYTSALLHTVAVGKPSPDVREFARITNEALDLLFKTVKPGRIGHDVAVEIGAGLKEISARAYNFGVFGYSVGVGLPPSWAEDGFLIREGNEQEFRPGMTFHSPITLRIAGVNVVGFSETWAVTESGCEVLTKHDRHLTIV